LNSLSDINSIKSGELFIKSGIFLTGQPHIAPALPYFSNKYHLSFLILPSADNLSASVDYP